MQGVDYNDLKRVVNVKGTEVDCVAIGKLLSPLLPPSATVITEQEPRSPQSIKEPTHNLTAAAKITTTSAVRTALPPLSENPGT